MKSFWMEMLDAFAVMSSVGVAIFATVFGLAWLCSHGFGALVAATLLTVWASLIIWRGYAWYRRTRA